MKTLSIGNPLRLGLAAALSLALLGGCATTPENDMLSEARQEVNQAQQTPAVTQYAALKLQEAEENLQKAENLWEEEGDDEVKKVEHYAYLAKQQAATALARGELGQAREQMDQIASVREQILRQSREEQLQAAEARAETAEQRAERLARSQGRQEDQDLQELRQTVKSLKAQQTDRGMVLTLGDVLFDFDQSDLKPGGERAIQQLAQFLEENPDRQILVEGYTDSIGDQNYNQQLAQRRADAVREQLVQQGISPDRVEIKAQGESYPVATNETTAGRQLNRRVEVVIGQAGDGTPEPRQESPAQETPARESGQTQQPRTQPQQ